MNSTSSLTSGRLLARNMLLNLAGEAAPFLVAIFAIPVLVHNLGVDRYGVLTLASMVVGYFGVFDFGLGRAATKFMSEAIASGERSQIPGLFWTSLYLMFGLGFCGGALLAALSPWLVFHALRIPPPMRGESLHAFYVLAFSLPFVISNGSFGGTLSAFQRFDLINALRVPTGVMSFLAPLLVLPFSCHLGWLVVALVLVRISSWLASFAICIYAIPEVRQRMRAERHTVGQLVGFGRWVAASSTIAPIVEYADRVVIGAVLSVAAVAYYAIPFQVTGKLRTLPAALSGVMFPAFSASLAHNSARTALLFGRATRYLLLVLFPAVLLMMVFAPELLSVWVGRSVASHGTAAMRWLAVGVLFNSIAWMPSALIQAAHRPDLITKLRVAELPFFFGMLWWTLSYYGVAGAAITWMIRSLAEMLVLFLVTRSILPQAVPSIVRTGLIACIMIPILIVGCLPMSLAEKTVFFISTLGGFAASNWMLWLDQEEKQIIAAYLRDWTPTGLHILD